MKRLPPHFFTFQMSLWLLTILCFSGCKTKEVKPTIIPPDAQMVFVMDFKEMAKKAIDWKDLLNTDVIAQMTGNSNSRDFIAQMVNAGFDYESSAYLFLRAVPRESKVPKFYFGVAFDLKDARKFESALQKDFPDGVLEKKGKIKYFTNQKMVLAWEGNKALLFGSDGETEAATLKAEIDKTLAIKPEESLEAKNTNFKEALGQAFDMAIWIDYRSLYSEMMFKALEEQEKAHEKMIAEKQKNTKDSPETATTPFITPAMKAKMKDLFNLTETVNTFIHFEKGKVTANTKTFFNQAILDKYKDVIKDQLDAALIKVTPIQSPAILSASAIGLKGIQKILADLDLLKDQRLTAITMLGGVSLDQVFEMLSGDFVFALQDFKVVGMMPEVNFAFGLGIKNKEILNKIIDNLGGFVGMKKKGDFYVYKNDDFGDFYFIEKDNYAFLTMSEGVRDSFLKGENTLKSEYADLSSGKLSSIYVDFQKLFKMIPDELLFSDDLVKFKKIVFPALIAMKATANPLSGNVAESNAEINLKDKDKNALAVLIAMIRAFDEKSTPIL
jgi:hypothetical protein